MDISVVIPLYNKELYIKRAIESVLNQSYHNFELIIVDDGSTDNSAHNALSYNDPRILLIKQENKGVSAARNLGILSSKSDLIAFLDADDEWSKNHLEVLMRLRKKFPQAGIYATAWAHSKRKNEIQLAQFAAIPQSPWEGILPNYFKSAALGEPPACSSSVCIPRSVFDIVGFFKEGIIMGEDLDMWGRIAIRFEVAFSWNGIAIYHEESLGRTCNTATIDGDPPFVESAKSYYAGKSLPKYVSFYVNRKICEQAIAMAENNDKKQAILKIIHVNPLKTRPHTYMRTWAIILIPKKLLKYVRIMLRNLTKIKKRQI